MLPSVYRWESLVSLEYKNMNSCTLTDQITCSQPHDPTEPNIKDLASFSFSQRQVLPKHLLKTLHASPADRPTSQMNRFSNTQPTSNLSTFRIASLHATQATMDDERERQQRDLQRSIALLETMSREELVDMLHDILYNERSDDTRKLSDWMAFQIIMQDETRDARRLLAQLGKVSANHLHVFWHPFQVHWSSERSQLPWQETEVTAELGSDFY